MDLSIIIVNYNSANHVINCIDSILQCKMKISYEIILVDNCSSQEDTQSIQKRFPDVQLLQMGYNAGFARANNRGIEKSKGAYILLLNADTLVRENAIERVYHSFSSQEKYIACGVQLLNADGTLQHSGAKFVKGGTNTLLPLPYLGKFIKKSATKMSFSQPNVFEVSNDIEVDWVVGAFILTSRKVIEKAGKLDEDFFMYAEEVDWCQQVRRAGWAIWQQPAALVTHIGGASSRQFRGAMLKALWQSRLHYWARWCAPHEVWWHRCWLRLGMWRLQWLAWWQYRRGALTHAEYQVQATVYREIRAL